MKRSMAAVAASILALTAVVAAQDIPIPAGRAKQIFEATPTKARVKPAKMRRVLIFNTPKHLLNRDPHKGYCTPYGCEAMKVLGKKTGAYEPVASDDASVFLPDSLATFDAVIFNNAAGDWITPTEEMVKKVGNGATVASLEAKLKKSVKDWLRAGHGVVTYHFGLGANRKWKEFGEFFGARIAGHPWNTAVGVTVEEPGHPLLAAFGGKGFWIREEVFQYREPFDRAKVRVLLSLDNDTIDLNVKNYRLREDKDFALAWVKTYGRGRVFYAEFGHRTETYWNPAILQFYLDGIQFAIGDLKVPTEPRPAGAAKPARPPKEPPADLRKGK